MVWRVWNNWECCSWNEVVNLEFYRRGRAREAVDVTCTGREMGEREGIGEEMGVEPSEMKG